MIAFSVAEYLESINNVRLNRVAYMWTQNLTGSVHFDVHRWHVPVLRKHARKNSLSFFIICNGKLSTPSEYVVDMSLRKGTAATAM